MDNIIRNYLQEFKDFIGTDFFPEIQLQQKVISLKLADERDYETAAITSYDFLEDTHTLIVSDDIPLFKYLLFHEFTHIWDTEQYANKDKNKYAGISGFTEYHASQIELMVLLDAKTITSDISFSMNDKIETLAGVITVQEYIMMKYNHAIKLFSRKDFPADIEMLKTAMGVWFNYMGLRSICEMYATDYVAHENENSVMMKHISSLLFIPTNNLMHGWLNQDMINGKCILFYWNIFMSIVENNRLA